MNPLGREIKALRTDLGWSKSRLGREVGCSHVYIYQIETGKRHPSKALLQRLALALDTDFEALDVLDPRLESELITWANETPGVRELLLQVKRSGANPQEVAARCR